MNRESLFQHIFLYTIVLLAFFSFGFLVLTILSPIRRKHLKHTDIIQAIVAVLLGLAAVYGFLEYNQIRRPYISLMKIRAISNFTLPGAFIMVPGEAGSDERLKDRVGSYIPSENFADASSPVKDSVEEILVDLEVANTGPLAGVDCQIRKILFKSAQYESLAELWAQVEKEHPDRVSILADDIVLHPQQEQTYSFMFHRKEEGFEPGKTIYVLCDIKYNSIEGGIFSNKTPQAGIEARRTYRVLNLYSIWRAEAYTEVIHASLKRSEIIE